MDMDSRLPRGWKKLNSRELQRKRLYILSQITKKNKQLCMHRLRAKLLEEEIEQLWNLANKVTMLCGMKKAEECPCFRQLGRGKAKCLLQDFTEKKHVFYYTCFACHETHPERRLLAKKIREGGEDGLEQIQ